jgi:hypothetical protein
MIRNLKVEHIWVLVVFCGIFVFLNTHPIRPHDFWWHIAIGQEVVNTGQIPQVDVFSQTMSGAPYPAFQIFWMMGVFLYAVYSLGGPALVVFMNSLLITGAYFAILLLCMKSTSNWRFSALALFFAAALGMNDWNVRPQAGVFILGSGFLFTIYSLRISKKPLKIIVFPLLMLVWANSHGSFILGLFLLGTWLADEIFHYLRLNNWMISSTIWKSIGYPLTALVLTGSVTFSNPMGWKIYLYVYNLSGDPAVQSLVPEWAPPTFLTLHGTFFLLGMLVLSVVLSLSPRRPDFFQLTLFIGLTILGLKTVRGAIWYGMFMAPILAEHTAAIVKNVFPIKNRGKISHGSPVVNQFFAGFFVLATLLSLPWFKGSLPMPDIKAGLLSSETPVLATQFLLDNNLPGPIFHDMAYGSYLIWKAQPSYPVFVDSRIELYPLEHWMDYIKISRGETGWEQILEHFHIQSLMLDKDNQSKLIQEVNNSIAWEKIFEDGISVIFTRLP